MKRAFFIALAACGPAASGTIVEKPPAAAFVCPSTPPNVNADPAALAPLVGQAIAHVCVVGGSNEARAKVSSSLVTKPGDRLDTMRVRDDVATVTMLPMIDDVTASATRVPEGLTIFYAIREKPVIAGLGFEGVEAFTRAELAAAPIAEGQHFDPRTLRRFARTLEKAYVERGFGGAKVDYDVKPGAPGKVIVVITVREGVPWRYGAIAFQGNKILTQAELAKAVDVQTGDAWNADRLERAALLVQALAYNHGLLESTVKATHGATAANGDVPVTVTIHEGIVFMLRKISIRGVTPAVEKQALAAMKAKPKTVFARDVLVADLDVMRTALGMDVEPQTTLDVPAKSVDLVLVATPKTPKTP
ncbi:MAG TPA: POTRA domain-containing protein [Polyangiaceae bacterium]|jgi:outer membrane protein assembly factor BamA|nr:POTRA domain-containing protein [Polyangiaceae bacterium]